MVNTERPTVDVLTYHCTGCADLKAKLAVSQARADALWKHYRRCTEALGFAFDEVPENPEKELEMLRGLRARVAELEEKLSTAKKLQDMNRMKSKELLLASCLLASASDEFSNHCCNDMPKYLLDKCNFSEEEKRQLAKQYSSWNGDNEPMNFYTIPDFAWMSFLSAKLVELAILTDVQEAK